MKIYVAALKEEIQEMDFFHLTGVGKINATYRCLELIHQLKPTEIINYGTAGAINKNCKGLIQCTKFYQRDMDARGLMKLNLGETPFDAINEIVTASNGYSCGSGDSFVNSKIEMDVDVVDMEAYALAKVCKLQNIKFTCFKYISDNADSDANFDWIQNCKKGASIFNKEII